MPFYTIHDKQTGLDLFRDEASCADAAVEKLLKGFKDDGFAGPCKDKLIVTELTLRGLVREALDEIRYRAPAALQRGAMYLANGIYDNDDHIPAGLRDDGILPHVVEWLRDNREQLAA